MRACSRRIAALGTVILAAFAAAPGAAAHQDGESGAQETARSILFDEAKALQYSQQAIGRRLGDYGFVTARGEPFRLSALSGVPIVINLVYTSCNDVCPLTVQALARAVETGRSAVGRDAFRVLTIGFDTRADTPQRMRDFAHAQGIDFDNWDFLSADAATIERLTQDLGFLYVPTAGGFDHLSQLTLVNAEGKVARQIYGTDFPPQTLVEPLKQLVYGGEPSFTTLSGLLNRVKLICTIYDPAAGRYRFSYAIFIELVVGGASLAGLGFFIVRLWFQARHSGSLRRQP